MSGSQTLQVLLHLPARALEEAGSANLILIVASAALRKREPRATASSRVPSPIGLKRAATGCACSIMRRVSGSSRPVIIITGKLRPDFASVSQSSNPFISGRCISTSMHASVVGISLASSALGRSKVLTWKPAARISLASARSIDGSSSTTRTVAPWSLTSEFGF